MRKPFLLTLIAMWAAIAVMATDETLYGTMKQWKTHLAYTNVQHIANAGDRIYALAGGALFSVDKQTEEITYHTKQDGLHGSTIAQIGYDKASHTVVIAYSDGLIDFIQGGNINALTDLSTAQITSERNANSMCIANGKAYLAMPFGIVVINVKKQEITDTYYIGKQSSAVNVLQVAVDATTIYARTQNALYTASLQDNLADYNVWKQMNSLPGSGDIHYIGFTDSKLLMLRGNQVWTKSDSWTESFSGHTWTNGFGQEEIFLSENNNTIYQVINGTVRYVRNNIYAMDVVSSGSDIWMASPDAKVGLCRYNNQTQESTYFQPNGPAVNYAYRIRVQGKQVMVVPGGYDATAFNRPGYVMIYQDGEWHNITQDEITRQVGKPTNDYSDGAIDPQDPNHFFIASYGTSSYNFTSGLLEFHGNKVDTLYDYRTLDVIYDEHVWIDALQFDKDGNLWMNNKSQTGVKVLMKDRSWVKIENSAVSNKSRMHDLLIWNQNDHIKIITNTRSNTGLGVFDDRGTIINQRDDRAIYHTVFVDQDNKGIQPQFIYSIAQMSNGQVWLGTENGILIFDNIENLFSNNSCRRVKIPRNDGTNLADYLLGNEAITAIAEDGSGRKWIGTASSGIYLMSANGVETIEHFTIENSPLPTNDIQAIAILPSTGEVFIGTGGGLVSYQSDAAASKDDFDNIYVYPNPVQPQFQGIITIAGLMNETTLYITDSGGNIVCKTHSNGGLATWDGKDFSGRRVASGIYTVLCNTADGGSHAVCKFMIL